MQISKQIVENFTEIASSHAGVPVLLKCVIIVIRERLCSSRCQLSFMPALQEANNIGRASSRGQNESNTK